MWRPWGKSSSRKSPGKPESPSSSPSPSSLFRCSSFKDIETLCLDSDSFLPPLPDEPNSKHPHHHQQHRTSAARPRSIFHRVRTANNLLRHWAPARSLTSKPEPDKAPAPSAEDARIVVYYTSFRVVRSTFEDGRKVLSIFQGLRVAVDERDVAMDSGFMTELRERLGSKEKVVTLPRVFIGGRYIGGAEEVVRLNEIGELKKLVQGVPAATPGTCGTCGGYKFILCAGCSGSHKIFSQKTGLRLCTACNENGLIRCPRCCCPSPDRPISAHRNAC